MSNDNISWKEAEQVKDIMSKNKLSEQEAIELLNIRSGSHFVDSGNLLKTEPEKIREIMNKNALNEQEAIELLNIRLKLHH
jgi:hypothetical protein